MENAPCSWGGLSWTPVLVWRALAGVLAAVVPVSESAGSHGNVEIGRLCLPRQLTLVGFGMCAVSLKLPIKPALNSRGCSLCAQRVYSQDHYRPPQRRIKLSSNSTETEQIQLTHAAFIHPLSTGCDLLSLNTN